MFISIARCHLGPTRGGHHPMLSGNRLRLHHGVHPAGHLLGFRESEAPDRPDRASREQAARQGARGQARRPGPHQSIDGHHAGQLRKAAGLKTILTHPNPTTPCLIDLNGDLLNVTTY